MTIRKKPNAASCLSSLIMFTALLLSCSTAFSQQGPIAKACVADLKAQCAGIQPGDGRIKACIKAHFADVSKNCLAVVLKAAAIAKECAADVKQNCADIKPGGGRIEACLKSHLADLSEPCKEALGKVVAGSK